MTTTADPYEYASAQRAITYSDTADHFERGLLRLMSLDEEGFKRWIALAEAGRGTVLERLRDGFAKLRPAATVEGESHATAASRGPYAVTGSLRHRAIAEDPAFGIAVNAAGDLGWLVDRSGAWVDAPPAYEEAYFEDPSRRAGGYGSYLAQSAWRLEKAARQVRELADATGLRKGRALDVGSGYGFFRKALEDAGFDHRGVEISAHGRRVAEEIYGFETYADLANLEAGTLGTFDLVTLWDVIEHVADPGALLGQCARALKPGGVVALKTPNLDCPEAEVFGPHYHSFRREHLVYFTPRSLGDIAGRAGLDVVAVSSLSHLLAGFVGREQTATWERQGRGADIVAYFRRPNP